MSYFWALVEDDIPAPSIPEARTCPDELASVATALAHVIPDSSEITA